MEVVEKCVGVLDEYKKTINKKTGIYMHNSFAYRLVMQREESNLFESGF